MFHLYLLYLIYEVNSEPVTYGIVSIYRIDWIIWTIMFNCSPVGQSTHQMNLTEIENELMRIKQQKKKPATQRHMISKLHRWDRLRLGLKPAHEYAFFFSNSQ